MKTIDIVKTGAGLAASYGAGSVVKDIVKTTLPPVETTSAKVFRWIGVAAISGIAGYLAEKWAKDQVDDIVALVKMVQEAWDESQEVLLQHRDERLDISDKIQDLANKVTDMTDTWAEGDEQNEIKEETADGGKIDAGEDGIASE